MAGNVPNVSRDSFDFSKQYGPVVLQQGVPIHDSDWNEMMDNLWIRGTHAVNHTVVGDCRLKHTQLGGTTNANSGMQVIEHGSPTNDFVVTDGWAMVAGVLVPSSPASPPQSFDYDDQVMFTGTVSTVGGGDIEDEHKNWSASHSLVDCRVKMTSGVESGNWFTISALVSATELTLTAGTGSIAATDTYEIYPPSLTTPSGGDRDDLAYLHVFFDDIATEEDSNITHPGTSVEGVHKAKIVSVVRVLEGSTTMPTPTEANLISYGHRYLSLAVIERLDANASITTAMITNTDNIRRALGHLEADSVAFDDTIAAGIGYPASTYVQDALDNVVSELDSADGAALVQGDAISDTPDSLSAGTLQAMLTALLGLVNDRVETIHPTTAPSAPVLLWRSHGVTSDGAVDEDTVSIYYYNHEIGIITGGYVRGIDGFDLWLFTSGTAATNVDVAIIGYNNFFGRTNYLSAATDFEYGDSNWSTAALLNNEAGSPPELFRVDEGVLHFNTDAYIKKTAPASSANADYLFRQYFDSVYANAEISKGYTVNRVVNGALSTPGTGSTLVPIDSGVNMSNFQTDGDDGLFRFLCSTVNKAGFASGHGMNSTEWSARLKLCVQAADKGPSEDYIYNCFDSIGKVYEEVIVTTNEVTTVSAGTYVTSKTVGFNFRNRFNTAPSALDTTGLTHTACTSGIAAVDNWGFHLWTLGTGAAATYTQWAQGTVECYS